MVETRSAVPLGDGADLALESGHDLFCEPLQLLDYYALGSAHGMAHAYAFQSGIFLLHRLELLDDPVRRSGQESLGLDGALSPWAKQPPPTYLSAWGIDVLAVGDWLDRLSNAS